MALKANSGGGTAELCRVPFPCDEYRLAFFC